MLGTGLPAHFQGEQKPIGLVVFSCVLISFGTGTVTISQDMAVMAPVTRDQTPMLLALLALSENIGGAIGSAVSNAVFAQTFQRALYDQLPSQMKKETTRIYLGGYVAQTKFKVGTPVREAINSAWASSQRFGCIAAVAVLVIGFPVIAIWKNYLLDKKRNI